jgi:UDP-glucose 4-epimerase
MQQDTNGANQRSAMMKTILVTGGSGLVGTRLLPRLVEEGHRCRALLRPGRRAGQGVEVLEGDLLRPESLGAALNGVSEIVHLAAQFRAMDDEATWRVNHQGTRNLISAALEHSPQARFIMASTSMVYSPDSLHPGRESDPAEATLAYPASKLAAERDLRASRLKWSILRLGFVYGEGDGHLESVPELFRKLKHHPATTFSLVHHRDVAAAVRLALSGGLDGRVVNIVDEAPITAYEMAGLVGVEMAGSSDPLPNPWKGRVDGSLARGLGFRPEVRTVHQAAELGLL